MSHIVTIKTKLRDIAAVMAACKRVGWEFRKNQTTFRWYGHYVGDYRTWEKHLQELGIKPADYGKCTHAIRIPGAGYEIGLVQKGNGELVPLWDQWHAGGLNDVTETNGMKGFMQAYAIERAKIEARRKGYTTREKKMKDGSVRVEIVLPS